MTAEEASARIHDSLRQIRLHGSPSSVDAGEIIKDALERGGDPNALDANGLTPLQFLATNVRALGGINKGPYYFTRAAKVLIEYGADPMLPGCDFLTHGNTFTLEACLEIMKIQQDKTGQPPNFFDGQNPLHGLARGEPQRLIALLNCCHVEWHAQARRSDGATPLHVLWTMSEERVERAQNDPVFAQGRWNATHALMEQGANLSVPTTDGTRVSALMVKAVNDFDHPIDRFNAATLEQAWHIENQYYIQQNGATLKIAPSVLTPRF